MTTLLQIYDDNFLSKENEITIDYLLDDYLLNISLEDYQIFVYSWAALGICTGLGIYFLKLMAISGKVDNHTGVLLGSVGKRLGRIIMEHLFYFPCVIFR